MIGNCNMDKCDLDDLKRDVKDILSLIKGEGTHKDSGLIERLKAVEIKARQHDRALWLLIGGGSIVITFLQLITGCK